MIRHVNGAVLHWSETKGTWWVQGKADAAASIRQACSKLLTPTPAAPSSPTLH